MVRRYLSTRLRRTRLRRMHGLKLYREMLDPTSKLPTIPVSVCRKLWVTTVPSIFLWKSASPVKRKPRHIEVCTGNANWEEDITFEEVTSSPVFDEDRITAHQEEITQLKFRNEELQENLHVERENSLVLKATVAYQNNARIMKGNLFRWTDLTWTKT